ncbi:serine-arginine protein 55 [Leptinotarsa decemlineata]|uniref:serine-arginine protein 55 n=1 Tax=Leptinotarsa decemlineata TaxID=7539 RepID=UPI000C254573|nr:serine-arginine protein 55-like [Leptinotarsa decemlineata]
MSTRVFVGGLTHKIRERDLEKFFKKYGRIKEVSMKNGYAFVEFDDHRDADDACYELNGKDLMGERITVERARGTPRGSDQWRGRDGGGRGYGGPPRGRNSGGGDNSRTRDKYGPPTRTEYRVIIENLSSRCSWQDLKDIMRKAGEVTFADAHKLVPNEGVVEFVSYSDMKNAIEKLDDIEINGRRIRVIEDRRGGRKNNRSPSRSRSRSRRRSKSRSGSRSKSRSRSRSRSHSKENNRKRSNSRSEERN